MKREIFIRKSQGVLSLDPSSSSAPRLPECLPACWNRPLLGPCLRLAGLARAEPGASVSSGKPTSRLHDQRGRSTESRWPRPTLRPRSGVRNFRNSREFPSSCWMTTTTHRTSLGWRDAAAFCKQYRRRLSRVYHSRSPYSSAPVSSTIAEPSSSRNLHRHWITSISGKGGDKNHQSSFPVGTPGTSSRSSGRTSDKLSLATSPTASSTSLPSWNSGRMCACEKWISSGDSSLRRPA
mmetsp:Transcript_101788/g.227413  ORF Transcript_101788/g.227413 Transcript_101788/m.227413 type:complete len:237 (+) Transcript_101788:141-851(+)